MKFSLDRANNRLNTAKNISKLEDLIETKQNEVKRERSLTIT